MKPWTLRAGALALVSILGSPTLSLAQERRREVGGQPDLGATPETSGKPAAPQSPAQGAPSIASSLGPAGDPGRVRAALEARGIVTSFTYIGEVLGNPTGGQRQGAVYAGRLDGQLDVDLDKLAGLPGLQLHSNFYQIHGRGLSRDNLGNLLVASGIEALPSTRLYELWVEQRLLEGRVALRAGQLAADTEFLVSQYATLFVNSTYGWPAITAANLPSGGPAYPLATPGARLRVAPSDNLTLLAAVFNGDPAGATPGPLDPVVDPQRRNRSGTDFRLSDPPLVISEAALTYGLGAGEAALPGSLKLGGWHHFGRFSDQRFGPDRLSLADPSSAAVAGRLRGNDGVYAVLDQSIYRVPGSTDRGVGTFVRVSGSPADRNLISFYADGGLTFKGLLPGREDDTFGLGFGYARISRDAVGLDQRLFTGIASPVRSSEAQIEVTYQAQIVPGWTLQPDFQYVFRPGGNVANPREPNGAVARNAAIFGLRSAIRY